jgi:hypothetical protein
LLDRAKIAVRLHIRQWLEIAIVLRRMTPDLMNNSAQKPTISITIGASKNIDEHSKAIQYP